MPFTVDDGRVWQETRRPPLCHAAVCALPSPNSSSSSSFSSLPVDILYAAVTTSASSVDVDEPFTSTGASDVRKNTRLPDGPDSCTSIQHAAQVSARNVRRIPAGPCGLAEASCTCMSTCRVRMSVHHGMHPCLSACHDNAQARSTASMVQGRQNSCSAHGWMCGTENGAFVAGA